jgi:hypothetical protein
MRLVCFPSLGVGASLFTPFLMDSSIGLEPFALQTPEHETRRSEPLLTSLSDLVAGVMTAILSLMDRPCYSGAMALRVLLRSRLYVLSSVLISPCPAFVSICRFCLTTTMNSSHGLIYLSRRLPLVRMSSFIPMRSVRGASLPPASAWSRSMVTTIGSYIEITNYCGVHWHHWRWISKTWQLSSRPQDSCPNTVSEIILLSLREKKMKSWFLSMSKKRRSRKITNLVYSFISINF